MYYMHSGVNFLFEHAFSSTFERARRRHSGLIRSAAHLLLHGSHDKPSASRAAWKPVFNMKVETVMNSRITTIAVGLLTAMALVACTATRTQKTAGEQMDDSVITSRVKTALVKDLGGEAAKIDVETFRQRVQLNGFINSSDAKRSATRVAQNVKGVSSVENNLKLSTETRTAGEYIDDKVLVAKIKTALAEDPVVKAHEVNIEVRQGVVQLAGFVDTSEQKSRAAEVTRDINGVRSVDNQLEVKRR